MTTGNTLLHVAVINGIYNPRLLEAQLLHADGAARVSKSQYDDAVGSESIKMHAKLAIIKRLLKYGASLSNKNSVGETPLHLVASAQGIDLTVLTLFLHEISLLRTQQERGYIIDAVDNNGDTILIRVAKLTKIFNDSSRESLANERSHSVLMEDIIQALGLLLQHGATPSFRNPNTMMTAFDYLMQDTKHEYSEALLKALDPAVAVPDRGFKLK